MRLREPRRKTTKTIFRHADVEAVAIARDLETKRDGPRVLVRRREEDDRRPVLLARERQFADELLCSREVMHFDDDDVERARRRARHDDARVDGSGEAGTSRLGMSGTHDEKTREIDARAREARRVQGRVRVHPRAPRAPRTTLRRRDG